MHWTAVRRVRICTRCSTSVILTLIYDRWKWGALNGSRLQRDYSKCSSHVLFENCLHCWNLTIPTKHQEFERFEPCRLVLSELAAVLLNGAMICLDLSDHELCKQVARYVRAVVLIAKTNSVVRLHSEYSLSSEALHHSLKDFSRCRTPGSLHCYNKLPKILLQMKRVLFVSPRLRNTWKRYVIDVRAVDCCRAQAQSYKRSLWVLFQVCLICI